ncbi:MAG: SRPBCC family protein [Sphingomonadales bacterium]
MWIILAVIVIAIAIAALLAAASFRPDDFRIARGTSVSAQPEAIYPMIADFHRWTEWSPWETLDADLKRTYGGAGSGLGATYSWEGRKAGAGHMEIVGVTPPNLVSIKLDFIRPMKASNMAEFALRPEAGGTAVTWSMTGRQNLIAKVMGVFFSMDKLVGKDFETGLANIKRNAEQQTGDLP